MTDNDQVIQHDEKAAKPTGPRWGRIAAWVLVMALLAVVAVQVRKAQEGTVQVSQPAPEFIVTTFEGQDITPADRAGKVTVVNFWASWCAPCRVEHPNLTLLAAEGVPIYGINYKDNPDNALAFLDELGDPYIAASADPEADNALEWGVYGVPETFLVDGDGTIIMRVAGPVTQRAIEERLRPAMDAARSN